MKNRDKDAFKKPKRCTLSELYFQKEFYENKKALIIYQGFKYCYVLNYFF